MNINSTADCFTFLLALHKSSRSLNRLSNLLYLIDHTSIVKHGYIVSCNSYDMTSNGPIPSIFNSPDAIANQIFNDHFYISDDLRVVDIKQLRPLAYLSQEAVSLIEKIYEFERHFTDRELKNYCISLSKDNKHSSIDSNVRYHRINPHHDIKSIKRKNWLSYPQTPLMSAL